MIFQKEERLKENKPRREERLSDPRNMCLTLGLREPWRSASKPQVRAQQVHRTLGARLRLRGKKKGSEGGRKEWRKGKEREREAFKSLLQRHSA